MIILRWNDMLIIFSLIIQLFILLNPLYSVSFLIRAHKQRMNVHVIAVKSVITAFVIATIVTFFGSFLFDIFGITPSSFRIAGGIVLLLLGINMVKSQEENHHEFKAIDSLITLIATPLLTGPATISFITLKAYEMGKMTVFINVLLAFILVGMVFIILAYMIDKVNLGVVDIVSRVMGLFLSAVAIEMIAKRLFRCKSITGRYKNDRSSDVHDNKNALGEAQE